MKKDISITFLNKTITLKIYHLLVLFLLIGAFIRFYKLNITGLWLDEIFSMRGANPQTSLKDVYEYSKADQPPLYFMILNCWLKLFGYTDMAGRSLAALYGLLGIPAIYFLGKEFKDEKTGLLVAFMTTINWFHADFSREIRFYPLVFLLSTLSYLFFLRCIKRSQALDFILYIICTSLLLNTHYFALAVFGSQFVIFIVTIIFFHKRETQFIIGAALAGIISGLSLYHWLPVILSDLNTTDFHAVQVPVYFPVTFGWMYFKDPIACLAYGVCFILMAKNLIKQTLQNKLIVEDVVIALWIFIGFMIPLVYSWVRIPLLTPKYSTITLPGIFLFIACGFKLIVKEKIQTGLVIAIFIGAFIALYVSKPINKKGKGEDWREVGEYFSQEKLKDQPQIIFSNLAFIHQYYFDVFNNPQALVDQRWKEVREFKHLIDSVDKIWILNHSRYPSTEFTIEQRALLNSEFKLKKNVKFSETSASFYERK
jgi:mannosyltransferase